MTNASRLAQIPSMLKEFNKTRILAGLSPLVVKKQKCTRCSKIFDDHTKRLWCSPCRDDMRQRNTPQFDDFIFFDMEPLDTEILITEDSKGALN